MSTSLANPRRTKLATWPQRGTEAADQEQPATTGDTATPEDTTSGQ